MTRKHLAGAALALGGTYASLQMSASGDPLLGLSRALTAWVLSALGFAVTATAGGFTVGRVDVVWTADCSSLNLVGLVLALTVWSRRDRPFGQTWPWLLLAVPAGLVANTGRVLMVIAYRAVYFPAAESLQLHYFLSFVSIVLLLGPFTGLSWRHHRRGLLETVYVASALCLVAPFVSAPGGILVTGSTLLLLARRRLDSSQPSLSALTAWLLAGLFTASAHMESVWLTWLLLCPWFLPAGSIVRSPRQLVLLAGTIPLVTMHPVGGGAVVLAGVWEAWRQWRQNAPDGTGTRVRPPGEWIPGWQAAGVALLAVYPFLAIAVVPRHAVSATPPSGVMLHAIGGNNYRLRLVGQPRDLYLDWFPPSGDGRHHTLAVCMRFRGVTLRATRESDVLSDGQAWMREFFVVEGQVLANYQEYLWRTFRPFSPPGVHLVVSAPAASMTPGAFSSAAERLALDYLRAVSPQAPAPLQARID